MNILIPTPITDAMLVSSTIAEPSAAETAWVSGTNYVVGDVRIRTTTHRRYEAQAAITGSTTPPEDDPTRWLDVGPTDRWALFDSEVSTQSRITTPLSYVLRPGFFNAIGLAGLDGALLTITVKDAPGGTVVDTRTLDLTEPPLDWYDWAFGRINALSKVVVDGFVPYPDAEVTLTITAATGVSVGAGMLLLGDFVPLAGQGPFGGVQQGASAEPITYSYIATDEFGTTSIKRRKATTDLRCEVVMPRSEADNAVAVLQRVLDVPAFFVPAQAPGYSGLIVFGLGGGSVRYDSFNVAIASVFVKGMI